MKITTFVTGCALALALFLFAQRRQPQALPVTYHGIVDLTQSYPAIAETTQRDHDPAGRHHARNVRSAATRIEAPAGYARSLWTVDQIPPERLVAKLAVLDVRAKVKTNPGYEITVEDISQWEHANGQIPQGAVVVAETGWIPDGELTSASHSGIKRLTYSPGYSEQAARFLVEGRNVLGLGIDTPRVDSGSSSNSPVGQYTLSHSVYHLENVGSLERVPASGAVVMVAPMKLEGRTGGPVRVLALVK